MSLGWCGGRRGTSALSLAALFWAVVGCATTSSHLAQSPASGGEARRSSPEKEASSGEDETKEKKEKQNEEKQKEEKQKEKKQKEKKQKEKKDAALEEATAEMNRKERDWGFGASIFEFPRVAGSGITVNYEADRLEVDLSVSFDWEEDDSTTATVGSSLYFFVQRFPLVDFSLGVGAGYGFVEPAGPEKRNDIFVAEAAARIRLFSHPRVAIYSTAGLTAIFTDAGNSVVVAGRPLGALGFVYFF